MSARPWKRPTRRSTRRPSFWKPNNPTSLLSFEKRAAGFWLRSAFRFGIQLYGKRQTASTSIAPSFSTTAMPETPPSPFSTSSAVILSSTARRIVLRMSRAPLLPPTALWAIQLTA